METKYKINKNLYSQRSRVLLPRYKTNRHINIYKFLKGKNSPFNENNYGYINIVRAMIKYRSSMFPKLEPL